MLVSRTKSDYTRGAKKKGLNPENCQHRDIFQLLSHASSTFHQSKQSADYTLPDDEEAVASPV